MLQDHCLHYPAKVYKSLHGSFNELRAELCMRTSEPMSKLPPSGPVFLEHVKRAIWQTQLWVNARDPSVDLSKTVRQ